MSKKEPLAITLTEAQKKQFYVRVELTNEQKAELLKATGHEAEAIEVPVIWAKNQRPRVLSKIDLVCW